MSKTRFGLFVGTLALITVLIVSPAAAVPSTNTSTNSLDKDLNLEFAFVTPGIGTSAYARVFVFGGHDGSNMPLNDADTGFAETSSWVLVYANLANYPVYLTRIPFEAADGLNLMLTYPKGTSSTITKAAAAAAEVEAAYGVSLNLVYFDGGLAQDDFYLFHSGVDLFTDVADDVAAIDNDGFSTLLSSSTVTGAPVGWAAYGARDLSNSRVAFHGMGWVDADAIKVAGDVYTLSSANVFSSAISSAAGYGLSRVGYWFPYPIAPVANGITPATSNPLPHVTGQFEWDLRHPIDRYDIASSGPFSVSYKLAVSTDFPNVQNKMSINQTKLNTDGIFEVEFELTNIGAETAYDIDLNLPLSKEFGALVDKNISIYTIKPNYEIDEAQEVLYNFHLQAGGGTVNINYQLFNLTGWYVDAGTSNKAIWSAEDNKFNLFTGTYLGQTITVDIESNGGYPAPLINAFNSEVLDKLPTNGSTITGLANIVNPVLNNMGPALKAMFNESLSTIYQKEDKFVFDKGDFDIEARTVAQNAATSYEKYFLNKTIASLAPGESTTVSFRFTDVPTTADALALMNFNTGKTAVTVVGSSYDFPTATLISEGQNYYNFMQYMFQLHGFDGRPISYNLPDATAFTFDGGFWSDTFISEGLIFKYENAQGYPFFGMSNGQNIQFADDEAVIAATVELDKQNYNVGDPVHINATLENFGDLPATDVTVHLFHASLGREWRFERIDGFASIDVADVPAGDSISVQYDTEANTYLGFHTVFALVEFTTDAGQDPTGQLPDFFDLGKDTFEAGGEARHYTVSTLSGGLVLPKQFNAKPSIPEPVLVVDTEIISNSVTPVALSAGEEFVYKVTITNDGEAATTAEFTQNYNTDELEYLPTATVSQTSAQISDEVSAANSYGAVHVSGIELAAHASVTIVISFKLKGSGASLPPVVVAYSTSGDSSLGTTVDTGSGITVAASSSNLFMSADSAAQQSSKKSGSEDSSSSSYSASSKVGASVNTEGGNTSTVTGEPGFIGYGPEFLYLMLIPLSIGAVARKRRNL